MTFYKCFFTNEDADKVPGFATLVSLSDIQVSSDKVKEKLHKLKANKSPGPDGLHPRVLRELSDVISTPSIIMNKYLSEGVVPQSWADAHVSLLFKKGKRTDRNNYRP